MIIKKCVDGILERFHQLFPQEVVKILHLTILGLNLLGLGSGRAGGSHGLGKTVGFVISELDAVFYILMENVFKDDDPILIVNNFQSKSEKDEHRGFRNLLIGIVAMFRNPASHELKVEWEMSEQDALDILAMISYCHRRLDKAQKIRLG